MSEQSPCVDCGVATTPRPPVDGEWYMVHDAVWAAAGMPTTCADLPGPPQEHDGRGFLCVGCLERRLGRELTPDDFTDAPINFILGDLSTPRLAERLRVVAA